LTRESALFFLSQFTLSPSLFYEPYQLYFPFISESYSTTGHFVARQITPKHAPGRVDVPQHRNDLSSSQNSHTHSCMWLSTEYYFISADGQTKGFNEKNGTHC
jgi:hypothetical protein